MIEDTLMRQQVEEITRGSQFPKKGVPTQGRVSTMAFRSSTTTIISSMWRSGASQVVAKRGVSLRGSSWMPSATAARASSLPRSRSVAVSFHSSTVIPTTTDTQSDATAASVTTTTTTTATPGSQWADPAMRQYKFWNRESCTEKGKYSYLIEISPESIQRDAKILSLSTPDDPANAALHSASGLPLGASLLGVGTELSDFDHLLRNNRQPAQQPNVLFVSPSCPRSSSVVPLILAAFPTIQWIHVRSAGIDFVESEEFSAITTQRNIPVTNAKGQFSSSLAEYALLACSYFAKNIPRLIRQQQRGVWEKYDIEELRGKTLGVVGYGDIGKACVKLA